MKKVTLDDIKNHFSYCSDEGLTIGEYEEALLHRLYRTIETHERKGIEQAEKVERLEKEIEQLKRDKKMFANIATAEIRPKPKFTLSHRSDK